jgi:hypothetical protein
MEVSGQFHAIDALLPGEYSGHALVGKLCWSEGSNKDKALYVF